MIASSSPALISTETSSSSILDPFLVLRVYPRCLNEIIDPCFQIEAEDDDIEGLRSIPTMADV